MHSFLHVARRESREDRLGGKKISEKITWGKLIWKKRFPKTIMVKKDFEQIFEELELEKFWRQHRTILETSWRHMARVVFDIISWGPMFFFSGSRQR